MATGDLTTVEKVRTYLNLTSLDADAKLGGLISSSSAWVTSQIGHPILSATYTETVNGNGTTSLVLRRSPVVSVTSVTVDGDAVPLRATSTDSGYSVRDGSLDLVGHYFTEGVQNVVVVYRAGYEVTETVTVPATPYTVTTSSRWYDAISASLVVAGTTLTEVAASPSAGQYAAAASSAGFATYTFNAAQQALAVSITYATIPQDIEQAVIEHVALRYRDADRQGITNVSGDGSSATFSPAGPLAYIQGVIDLYRDLVVG